MSCAIHILVVVLSSMMMFHINFVCLQVRERALKEAEGIAKEVDTVAQGMSLVLL